MFTERLTQNLDESAVAAALSGEGAVWLDGASGDDPRGAWSYFGVAPVAVVRAPWGDDNPLRYIDALVGPREVSPATQALAHAPQWIGYVAYDAAWSGSGAARLPRPAGDVLWFGRYEALLARHHHDRAWWIVADDETAATRLKTRLAAGLAKGPTPTARIGEAAVPDADIHLAAIDEALKHIAKGNIYQVNLARRWDAPFAGEPLALFLAMRRQSPVPFGFFGDFRDGAGRGVAVACRSMETFLHWRDGLLTTRPIKGTVPRDGSRDPEDARTLVENPKERAEHTMIVDLMRNDLGRVAAPGTVSVDEALAVEPYAKIAHLVSTVSCRTRDGVTASDVLRATFPPGSVTGTPKIRAVQLIEALEPVPRGVYTGAVGYLDRSGGLSLAVAIRAAQISEGRVVYHAGGGIVEASDPQAEVAETELKAAVFLDALRAQVAVAKAGSEG